MNNLVALGQCVYRREPWCKALTTIGIPTIQCLGSSDDTIIVGYSFDDTMVGYFRRYNGWVVPTIQWLGILTIRWLGIPTMRWFGSSDDTMVGYSDDTMIGYSSDGTMVGYSDDTMVGWFRRYSGWV